MLTDAQKALIRSTIPVLREHGLSLTKHFYKRMFVHNPELKNVFNQGNQHKDQQQKALAFAVLGYAEHIDDPSVLAPVLGRIANKHISLDIRPEHYQIVGRHLIASISEVLGDAATEPLLEAWSVAYKDLADILIRAEADLYEQHAGREGGWSGWRPFIIRRKEVESEEITSFYLYPLDGGKVIDFQPGQYVSVRVYLPELGLVQPRQYSLSAAPNEQFYRISVKREPHRQETPGGMVSNHLHDHAREGDVLDVSAPAGAFTLRTDSERPIVLLSGGVGLTPMVSMLEFLVQQGNSRRVVWAHGVRGGRVHAMKHTINQWAREHKWLSRHVFYETISPEDVRNEDFDYEGLLDLHALPQEVLLQDADFYICGPIPFILKQKNDLMRMGIPEAQIFFELFGPQAM